MRIHFSNFSIQDRCNIYFFPIKIFRMESFSLTIYQKMCCRQVFFFKSGYNLTTIIFKYFFVFFFVHGLILLYSSTAKSDNTYNMCLNWIIKLLSPVYIYISFSLIFSVFLYISFGIHLLKRHNNAILSIFYVLCKSISVVNKKKLWKEWIITIYFSSINNICARQVNFNSVESNWGSLDQLKPLLL